MSESSPRSVPGLSSTSKASSSERLGLLQHTPNGGEGEEGHIDRGSIGVIDIDTAASVGDGKGRLSSIGSLEYETPPSSPRSSFSALDLSTGGKGMGKVTDLKSVIIMSPKSDEGVEEDVSPDPVVALPAPEPEHDFDYYYQFYLKHSRIVKQRPSRKITTQKEESDNSVTVIRKLPEVLQLKCLPAQWPFQDMYEWIRHAPLTSMGDLIDYIDYTKYFHTQNTYGSFRQFAAHYASPSSKAKKRKLWTMNRICYGFVSFFKILWHTFTSRVLLTAYWTFLCVYINCVLQIYVQSFAKWRDEQDLHDIRVKFNSNVTNDELNNFKVLPDLGFWVLQPLQNMITKSLASTLSDTYVQYVVLFTVVRFLSTPLREVIFRRTLAIYGALFLLRGFTISMTLLPNPSIGCSSTVIDSSPWSEALKLLTMDKFTCYDVLYSGHTVNLTVSGLIWHTYSHVVPLFDWDVFRCGKINRSDVNKGTVLVNITFVKFILWLIVGGGYIVIIATHFHYSVDVMLGSVISILMWKLYHHYVKDIKSVASKGDIPSRIFAWFENYSIDLHPQLMMFPQESFLDINTSDLDASLLSQQFEEDGYRIESLRSIA